jgi:RHS repeat-associated protein
MPPTPVQLNSYSYDEGADVVYNYYRTYDPSTGRYLESDPIGLVAGLNTYSYVSNMPTMRFDPFGLDELGIHSNVGPNDGFTSGHAWLSYTDDSGVTTNYGLWPDNHPAVPDNGPASDVRQGLEDGQSPAHSRYYDLDPQQMKKWVDYMNKKDEWKYTNTCAAWASDGVKYVVGEDVDADDWVFFQTPRELSESIIELESRTPTSPDSPLPPSPNRGTSQP